MGKHVALDAEIAMPNWPRLMSTELAAKYLGIGQSTLREKGPAARKFGARTLYDIRDLDRWADALAGQPLEPEQRRDEADDIARRLAERLNGAG